MALQINQHSKPGEVVLELIGTMDETTQLPYINSVSRLILELKGLTGLNSIGIRHFVQWGANHAHIPTIQLVSCPTLFAKNFSAVLGFLRPNMHVVSFIVPFYSPATHESQDVLLENGKDFTSEGSLKLPFVTDSEGNNMELDVIGDIFFRFLKK